MSDRLTQSTAQGAKLVCHDEQMVEWVDDIWTTLGLFGAIPQGFTYEQGIGLRRALARDIRYIVESAFTHPELAALSPEGDDGIAAASSQALASARAEGAADMQTVIPEGWQLVPVEPTADMMNAFWWSYYWAGPFDLRIKPNLRYADGYRAMLAAVPPLPLQTVDKAAVTPTIADPVKEDGR